MHGTVMKRCIGGTGLAPMLSSEGVEPTGFRVWGYPGWVVGHHGQRTCRLFQPAISAHHDRHMSLFLPGKPARRARSRSLPQLQEDLLEEEEQHDKKLKRMHMFTGAKQTTSWAEIVRAHAVDYVVLFAMMLALAFSELATPYQRYIYEQDDQEYWQYSYPLRVRNTVPSWAVPVISTMVPAAAFAVHNFVTKPTRLEAHNTLLACWSAVFATALATNLIKLGVGRPRPNFMARCFPEAVAEPVFHMGMPECQAGNVQANTEGRKSFPSGHTSWSTSGLGFLTLWLMGKLHVFDGTGHPARLVAASVPISTAVWIGITRLQDYWHHWQDVTVGFFLGLTVAYLFYRQYFPGLTDAKAGHPYITRLDGEEESQPYDDLEAATTSIG